ncbi:YceI family protein [Parafrankia discariae]|uniref:YceI family protein n=1 Tax=Parafrankia discariae TaxID=365528 RepID=UPI00035D81AC|nr:YceI family protein [Parafrankia discariae]
MADSTPHKKRRWPLFLVGAVVAVAVLVVGGTAFYINVIKEDAPEEFTLDDPAPGSSAAGSTADGSVDGRWRVGDGSEAGYRVNEVLFGQKTTAAGRTSEVSGTMTIADSAVTEATFEVQMASVRSDEDRRDNQFRGRIMAVDTYPTSQFTLTRPIDLGTVPAGDETRTYQATGTLTMHGTAREVTMDLQARRAGDLIQIVGQIPVTFSDYNIPNPSLPGISTEDHGTMEVSLRFTGVEANE